MQKFLTLLICCILFSGNTLAQELKAYKTFGGVRFEMDTIELTIKQVTAILKEQPTAHAEFKKAKAYSNAAALAGFSGAVLLAIPLGTAIAGGEPEWTMAAGGALLLLASIPLTTSYRTHTMNALDIFNENKSARIKTEFIWSGTRAKIVIRF
jgi:hypothetical protein